MFDYMLFSNFFFSIRLCGGVFPSFVPPPFCATIFACFASARFFCFLSDRWQHFLFGQLYEPKQSNVQVGAREKSERSIFGAGIRGKCRTSFDDISVYFLSVLLLLFSLHSV